MPLTSNDLKKLDDVSLRGFLGITLHLFVVMHLNTVF